MGERETSVRNFRLTTTARFTESLANGGLAPSAELTGPHSVNPRGDHNLRMLAIANIAAEDTRATLPAHRPSPARQVGLIVVGRDPARSLLRWLAFFRLASG